MKVVNLHDNQLRLTTIMRLIVSAMSHALKEVYGCRCGIGLLMTVILCDLTNLGPHATVEHNANAMFLFRLLARRGRVAKASLLAYTSAIFRWFKKMLPSKGKRLRR